MHFYLVGYVVRDKDDAEKVINRNCWPILRASAAEANEALFTNVATKKLSPEKTQRAEFYITEIPAGPALGVTLTETE